MSDDLHFSKAIRTIFLTGVGAVAAGAVKSKALMRKSFNPPSEMGRME